MELSITQDAAEEFNKSVEGIEPKPFLRVGAKPGGCSGWTFTLETEDDGVLSVTTSDFLIRPFNDGSFFVLINGEETDGIKFENKILTIPYSAGTEKIEVYGSYVVPEFGTIAGFILVASVVSIIILSKKHIMPHSLSKL